LVYQQQVLSQDGVRRVAIGHQQQQVALQEVWVSPPAPGTYYVHVSPWGVIAGKHQRHLCMISADASVKHRRQRCKCDSNVAYAGYCC
jgi:hypothetical protein